MKIEKLNKIREVMQMGASSSFVGGQDYMRTPNSRQNEGPIGGRARFINKGQSSIQIKQPLIN
jgi:hypothetical protein